MRIFLTGDTHIPIDISKLNMEQFPEQKNLTREDFVIVLGDFGLLWHDDKTYSHWLNWLKQKSFTLLWLDGNHENHDWINRLPSTEWNGGKVHFVADNVIHLMRGQIFDLGGKKFFVCGGATSIDKDHRTVGVSWWANEDLSWAESEEALSNLEKANYNVDFILTHTCPMQLVRPMFGIPPIPDPTANFLDIVQGQVRSAEWYFGHHHRDIDYGRFHCLYQRVVEL